MLKPELSRLTTTIRTTAFTLQAVLTEARAWKKPDKSWGLLFLAPTAALVVLTSCTEQSGQQQVARAPVPVKVAPVSKGSISTTLLYSGEVQSVDQVDLLPSASGRIQETYVEEGASVAAGTVLAQQETDTLEAQVRQAQANMQNTQARLDTVLQGARPEEIAASKAMLESLRNRTQGMINGSRPEEIAAAEASRAASQAAVSTARANLASAEARLKQLLNPTQEDVAAAGAALEAASSNVVSAQQRLEQLRNPTQADMDAAQAVVDSAKATLLSAQARLDDLKASPKPAEIAAVHASVQAAEASLRNAETTLANVKQPLNKEKLRNLIDAYAAVKIARDKLAFDKARGAPPEVIAADEDALNLAYRRLQLAEEEANTFQAGVTAEQLLAAQAAVDAARANLNSALARRDQVLAGATQTDLQGAQGTMDGARANLEAARIRLEKLKSPTVADIAAAQALVDQAESQRVTAANRLQTLKNPTTVDLQAAQATLEGARSALQTALASLATSESALAKARAPFTETDIAAQQALLEQAGQQLAKLANGPTSPEIAAATAAVAQAEAALDLTRIQLSKATIVAPFDALVAKKHVSKGALVSGQSPIFSLVSKEVRVVFQVEEAAVGRLRPGLPVTFATALSGERGFPGAIASIAPTADPASRSFKVKVAPGQGAEGLRAGTFANITVAVEQHDNVLLVPRDALLQQGNRSFVYIIREGQAEQRDVTPGLSNDRFSQITSGLEEGAQVVVQGNKTLRPQDRVNIIP